MNSSVVFTVLNINLVFASNPEIIQHSYDSIDNPFVCPYIVNEEDSGSKKYIENKRGLDNDNIASKQKSTCNNEPISYINLTYDNKIASTEKISIPKPTFHENNPVIIPRYLSRKREKHMKSENSLKNILIISKHLDMLRDFVNVLTSVTNFYNIDNIFNLDIQNLYSFDYVTTVHNKINDFLDLLEVELFLHPLEFTEEFKPENSNFNINTEVFIRCVKRIDIEKVNLIFTLFNIIKPKEYNATYKDLVLVLLREIQENKACLVELKNILLFIIYNYTSNYRISYYEKYSISFEDFVFRIIILVKAANIEVCNEDRSDVMFMKKMWMIIISCFKNQIYTKLTTKERIMFNSNTKNLTSLLSNQELYLPIDKTDYFFILAQFKNLSIKPNSEILPSEPKKAKYEDLNSEKIINSFRSTIIDLYNKIGRILISSSLINHQID
ncbi:hypothetical protein NGRA_3007 [Nosema granulosis]|uniref:Uncharacterized protein n=1 Tax=Nosema granulosis TaxID=83296 RepID=A0A9P6GWM8_9MICR|nr:hypothetical protein NGRA_3007 [Nosema granulosis]